MSRVFSREQWIEILHDERVRRPLSLRILQAVSAAPGHRLSAKEIGIALNEKTNNIILEIANRFVKNGILKHYQIDLLNYTDHYGNSHPAYYAIPFELEAPIREDNLFDWILRRELIEALEETGMAHDQISHELSEPEQSIAVSGLEGGRCNVIVTLAERNPLNRKACLEYWGHRCRVCDFDFGEVFGDIAEGFIHVHHHNPLASTGEIVSDPINDMSPLCPNCHAVAYLKNPPYKLEDLKQMRKAQRNLVS
jgi:5-methylcytosine-specific restriction enzyme A